MVLTNAEWANVTVCIGYRVYTFDRRGRLVVSELPPDDLDWFLRNGCAVGAPQAPGSAENNLPGSSNEQVEEGD